MRRDWWRFWLAVRDAPGYTRDSASITLMAGGKERCIGLWWKRDVEQPPTIAPASSAAGGADGGAGRG